MSAFPSSSPAKRKAPLSVSAGILSTEQAGQQGGAPSTAKRTRFDVQSANDEDAVGDLDIEEQDRKRNQQGRKGRVVTEGYDSDEDDDDQAAAGSDSDENDANRQTGGEGAGDDDGDEDMFNVDSEEEDGKRKATGKGRKRKKYLELKDIEGQEFSEHEDDKEEQDPDLQLESDEEAGGGTDKDDVQRQHDPGAVVQPLKKSKKPPARGDIEDMGYQIDSFNMKSEMASGRFDEEGNYIANAKDPHAEHDRWLEGNYSRKNIKAAKDAKERRERERRTRDAKRENADLDEDECKMRLTSLLRRGESVLEALQRLGGEAKKAKGKGLSGHVEESGKERAAGKELDQITSLSSELMSRYGRMTIYDATYESLLRDVRRSGLVRETWDPAKEREPEANGADEEMFTYRWSPDYLASLQSESGGQDEQHDDQLFGPFSKQDLQAWMQAGYFGENGDRILLRPMMTAGQETGWRQWQEIFV